MRSSLPIMSSEGFIIFFFSFVHNTSLLADFGQQPSLLDRLQDPADKKKGLTLKTMGEWESRLPEQSFARIHRSAIVNLEAVERVEEWFNYSFRVYLTGVEEPFIMSRR